MKYLLTMLLFCCFSVGAQSLFVETGKMTTSFKFKNSQALEFEDLQPKTQQYLKAGLGFELLEEKLNLTTSLSYSSYGAKASDLIQNSIFDWDVDYAGLQLGLEWTPIDIAKFEIILDTYANASVLVQGTQVTNTEVINLVGVGEFDTTAIFIGGGMAMQYPISSTTKLQLRYGYEQSLTLKQDTALGASELTIAAHKIGLGLIINMNSKEETKNKANQNIQQ